MALKDELANLKPKQRKFIYCRVVGLNTDTALAVAVIQKSTYKWYMQHELGFNEAVHKVPVYHEEYFSEAYVALRRTSRMLGLQLEQDILQRMIEEIQNGELNLAKTALGREVYSKAMEEGRVQPKAEFNWIQFVSKQQQLIQAPQVVPMIESGEVCIENSQAEVKQQTEYPEGSLV